MAIGATTTAFSSISASTTLPSLVFSSIFRRSFSAPINLTYPLATKRSPFRSIRKYHAVNAVNKNLSFESPSSPDVISKSSSPNSNNCYPPYVRLLPCPSQNGPPRVEHLVVSEGGPALGYICKALDLPPLYVADLIRFGAVFYALVCPDPPATATPEQIKTFKKYTDPLFLRQRSSIKGKTKREAQKTFRITRADEFVETGTYLRVHVHPKRFPRCYEIDWKSRIIAVTENYVGGTTDNIEETCATFATRALGLEVPLRTTHQIDNCSEGCVVFARTKEYCSVFHGKIREKKVKKLYLALVAAPMPIGVIAHYMRPVNIAPRLISEDFNKGWQLCQLEVLECKKVPWPDRSTEEKNGVEDCGWPSKDFAYECKINLLTGRTHQIRAQLAACGAPLVGDSMYMPAAIAEANCPGLNPFGKHNQNKYNEDDEAKSLAVEEWIACHGKEPTVAIGLQACYISWDDNGPHTYEAGSPWWRSGKKRLVFFLGPKGKGGEKPEKKSILSIWSMFMLPYSVLPVLPALCFAVESPVSNTDESRQEIINGVLFYLNPEVSTFSGLKIFVPD
ncbi:pseudouridine synthase family protein [Striga asiatica]|uniref:Pseudouridine synthase family protein n=1 Tax=Striga asiatica TaxID=4170 RepID=A0A5A7RGJ7_STRAF|nr:pseudouridine synthase family protein [Striga asiatica]